MQKIIVKSADLITRDYHYRLDYIFVESKLGYSFQMFFPVQSQ